nr:DUF5447 family protein [Pseudomonas sp. DY-1]
MNHEHTRPLPPPRPRRQLRLLCLLVPSRTGEERALPVHVLRALPPRADIQGRWALGLPAGLVLRETQARPPRPKYWNVVYDSGKPTPFVPIYEPFED